MALRSSFHYDNTFSAGIVVNIQVRDLLIKSSRTILAADISENPRFRFDYYKYTGKKKKVALNLRYDYFKEQIPIYNKGEKTDIETDIENSISLNLLTTQSLKRSYIVGYNYESNKFSSDFSSIFPDGLRYGEFIFSRGRIGYTKNSLNNRNFPTKGADRFLMFDAYFNNDYKVSYSDPNDSLVFFIKDDYSFPLILNENDANEYLKSVAPELYGTVYFRSLDYIQINKSFQVMPVIAFGLIVANDSSNAFFNNFVFGGHQQVKQSDTRFFGLNYAEKSLENFVTGGLFLQNVVYNNFLIKYGANVVMYHNYVPLSSLDDFDWSLVTNNQTILGYGGEITYKSFIGPVSLGVSSNASDGYVRYYFAIGYSFNYSD